MKRRVVQVMLVVGMMGFVVSSAKTEVKQEIVRMVEVPIIPTVEVEVMKIKPEKIYHTYIDKEYIGYVEEIGKMYNVCPELIFAMIEQESSGNPNAENAGCYGLMQISERWHRDRMKRLGVTDIFDPRGNILVGVDYLMELANEYGDLDMVLMTYNGSIDAKERWENNTPTEYVTSIVNRAEELERLHGR